MKRWLYAHRNLRGDPALLEETLRLRLRELVLRATGTEEPGLAVDGSFSARLATEVAGRPAYEEVRVHLGVADRPDQRVRIPIRWHATRARIAFPVFDGTVEIEPLDSTRVRLVLTGAASLPLGLLGAALDTAGFDALAERTVDQLVERLAAELQAAALEQQPVPQPQGFGLHVADVMTADPLVLAPDDSLRTAARLLYHHGVSGAPVVDEHGGLVGVLSERDLMEKEATRAYGLGRRVSMSERKRRALTVAEACSRPARTTVPEADLHAAARLMLDENVGRLVVVDGSAVAGIVTRHDVLAALVRSDDLLQAIVDGILADLGETGIEATVEWGLARLVGTATMHSRVPLVTARVAEVDGVLDVETDLDWAEDDVLPTMTGSAADQGTNLP